LHPAEARAAFDLARSADFGAGLDEPVLQALVIPLGMVVFQPEFG
jgi:hypothetical protein